jgi:hypothetical protein
MRRTPPELVLYADVAVARRVYSMTESECTAAINTGIVIARPDMGFGETRFFIGLVPLLNILSLRDAPGLPSATHAGSEARARRYPTRASRPAPEYPPHRPERFGP